MNDDDLKELGLGADGGGDMDDLEAQLAALGLGGSEDDGGFDDLDSLFAGGGGDDDDPFSALEALGEGGGRSSPPPSSGGGDLDDLDAQLEMLLNADKSADESFVMQDPSANQPIQTIYDPEVDGGLMVYTKGKAAYVEEEPKKRMFENVRLGHIVAVAVIGIAFLIVGGTTAVLAGRAVHEQQVAVQQVAHFTPISMPVDVANNANVIFVNQISYINNQRFDLRRISAGISGTFFYFYNYFDAEAYAFTLYDQQRNLYINTDFDMYAIPSGGTMLRFEQLSHNVLFLTLRIQCLTSRDYTSFFFRFEEPPVMSAAVYINHVAYEEEMAGFVIRHASFDDASSQIHYSYTFDPNANGIRKRADTYEAFILLRDGLSTMVTYTNNLASVGFDDFEITMGTATFSSVFNLNSRVEVLLTDLVYFYSNPVAGITPTELFARDQRGEPHTIQTGSHTLNLEAMTQQGNYVLMTLHGLDEFGRRVETIPSMSLRINASGSIIYIPSIVRSRALGSDVRFNLAPYLGRIRDVHLSNYSLVIHSVEYAVPQLIVPIYLSQNYNFPSMRRIAAETTVSEAFVALLSYMSNEIGRHSLVGLSAEFDGEHEVFDIFEPLSGLRQRPMYGANVVAGDMISNYDFLGVVQVQWVYGEGRDTSHFHETFKIAAHSTDGIWAITDIEVI